MPKRVGFLYEQMVSEENCILAERLMAKNKPNNRIAKHIGKCAERYGKELSKMLRNDGWVPGPNRERTIMDSYKGKTRNLKIPCLLDQSVQYAWLNIATPFIERRNYFYNCGSIPGAGQTRAVMGLKKWLGKKHPPKYGAVSDIRHFYDTLPHWVIERSMRRIFKDERFIQVGLKILNSMNPNGVGLAIGHPSSHWFANLALSEIDHSLCRLFPAVKFVRYMDDIGMVCNNKRHLRKALSWLRDQIYRFGMEIKHTWQLFQIRLRGLQFLSYRFFPGFTILSKELMYRISRKVRKASSNLTPHTAAGILSYMGILRWCDSYNFRKEYIYPHISIKKCKEVVSHESKNHVCHAA